MLTSLLTVILIVKSAVTCLFLYIFYYLLMFICHVHKEISQYINPLGPRPATALSLPNPMRREVTVSNGPSIRRFSEAGLLEWMRFVIFRARGRSTLPGRFLSRRCFMLRITVEVETRIAKQYKCQCCCSCKNYRGKEMGGEQKVSLHHFWADQKITSL